MSRLIWLALLVAAAVAGCSRPASDSGDAPVAAALPAAVPADGHTSRNSLDWAGTYEGLLPCDGCPGIAVTLVLDQAGTYTWASRRLVVGGTTLRHQGKVTWAEDGGSVTLEAAAAAPGFQVGEGRLIVLNPDGSRPEPGTGVFLNQTVVPAATPESVLEGNGWTLVSATDAGSARLDAFFPEPGRNVTLAFAGGRLQAAGGCNGLRAAYSVAADGRLSVAGGAATMMACAPPLMATDAALSAFFTSPLEFTLVQGPAPVLALLASTGEVLVFKGEATLEARFGPATLGFLEVAPQRVPCPDATGSDGLCLQVREIRFDEQGLRVGEPGEFAPFPGAIQGFEHAEGVRNVIRVKRFQSDATPGEGVTVLDLVVESEQMKQ